MPKRRLRSPSRRRRKVVDPPAFEVDLAIVGNVQRAQQVQERGLAAAALADDGQELALPHGQAHAAEHRHFDRALAIGLLQPRGQQLRRSAGRVPGHDETRAARRRRNVGLRLHS